MKEPFKVNFINIGYSNQSFIRLCKSELTYEWLYKQVKPYIMSRNVSFSYDEETNKGYIFGGFHTIGEFEVEK